MTTTFWRTSFWLPALLLPAAATGQEAIPEEAPWTVVASGAVIGGGAGLLLGGLVGGALGGGGEICGDDPCGFEEAIYGAFVGEVIGLPLGAHLANGREGPLGGDLLASAVTALAGATLIAAASRSDSKPLQVSVAVGAPLLQVVATVLAERRAFDREVARGGTSPQ